MTILNILQYPDLRLRRKGYLVGNVKAIKIQKIIHNMVETLLNTQHCAGLAATQLDLAEPPNITVINTSAKPTEDNILCLVNLKITHAEGEAIEPEGCMSIYPHNNINASVKRAAKVKVTALDRNGNQLEFEATDHLAKCLQHEYDHLRGVLYIDHLSKEERRSLDEKIAKLNQANKK